MKYQKFIPGDVVKGIKDDEYFIVVGSDLEKNDLIRLQYESQIQNCTTTSRSIGLNEYYELIYRTFPRISDYHCRELCKIKSDCRDCPLRISPKTLKEMYFLGDEVTIGDDSRKHIYRATIIKVSIPDLYLFSSRYRPPIIPSSRIKVEEAIDILERYRAEKGNSGVVYGLKFSGDDGGQYSITREAKDIRLFYRKGYTLDEDILEKVKIINGE